MTARTVRESVAKEHFVLFFSFLCGKETFSRTFIPYRSGLRTLDTAPNGTGLRVQDSVTVGFIGERHGEKILYIVYIHRTYLGICDLRAF